MLTFYLAAIEMTEQKDKFEYVYNRKAILIYISALVQYAIEGYSVHAFQYLLK